MRRLILIALLGSIAGTLLNGRATTGAVAGARELEPAS